MSETVALIVVVVVGCEEDKDRDGKTERGLMGEIVVELMAKREWRERVWSEREKRVTEGEVAMAIAET